MVSDLQEQSLRTEASQPRLNLRLLASQQPTLSLTEMTRTPLLLIRDHGTDPRPVSCA
jgi:hypothetical protein